MIHDVGVYKEVRSTRKEEEEKRKKRKKAKLQT